MKINITDPYSGEQIELKLNISNNETKRLANWISIALFSAAENEINKGHKYICEDYEKMAYEIHKSLKENGYYDNEL